MTEYTNVCGKCGLLLATWKKDIDPGFLVDPEPEPFRLTSPEREAALEKQLADDHAAEQREGSMLYREGYNAGYDAAFHEGDANRRERIATAALQGMLACPPDPATQPTSDELHQASYASYAVAYADALIAALDGERK